MNPKNTFLQNLKTSFVDPFTKLPGMSNYVPPASSFQGPPAPNMSVVPSNFSATNTTQTKINTPTNTTSQLPQSGKDYVSSQINQTPPVYDNVSGARTAYGASIGAKDMLGGEEVSSDRTNSNMDTVAPPKAKDSPYMAYLKSFFDPEALKTAQSNVNQINERTSKELLRTREREEELRANKIGQLERGQQYQLGEEERLSNRSLADLAIAKGASVDVINQIMAAGKEAYGSPSDKPIEVDGALYEKQEDGTYKVVAGTPGGAGGGGTAEGFTLSPGESRFDAAGNLIASGGAKPMTATQEAAAQAKTEKEIQAQEQAGTSLSLINNLLSNDRYKSISGGTQTGSIPFFGDRAAVNEYNQLTGLLKLGIRGLIKGQGAVSDYEGKILAQASSALSRLTSEAQMKQALLKVRGVLRTNNGESTQVIVRDEEGNTIGTGFLNGQDIYDAVNDGNTIEYM